MLFVLKSPIGVRTGAEGTWFTLKIGDVIFYTSERSHHHDSDWHVAFTKFGIVHVLHSVLDATKDYLERLS